MKAGEFPYLGPFCYGLPRTPRHSWPRGALCEHRDRSRAFDPAGAGLGGHTSGHFPCRLRGFPGPRASSHTREPGRFGAGLVRLWSPGAPPSRPRDGGLWAVRWRVARRPRASCPGGNVRCCQLLRAEGAMHVQREEMELPAPSLACLCQALAPHLLILGGSSPALQPALMPPAGHTLFTLPGRHQVSAPVTVMRCRGEPCRPCPSSGHTTGGISTRGPQQSCRVEAPGGGVLRPLRCLPLQRVRPSASAKEGPEA